MKINNKIFELKLPYNQAANLHGTFAANANNQTSKNEATGVQKELSNI